MTTRLHRVGGGFDSHFQYAAACVTPHFPTHLNKMASTKFARFFAELAQWQSIALVMRRS